MDGSNKDVGHDIINIGDVKNKIDLVDVYSCGGGSTDDGGVDDFSGVILMVVIMLTAVMVIANLIVGII